MLLFQGAFRMRGIGKGQKIRLVIIPEVAKLIRTQVRFSTTQTFKYSNIQTLQVDFSKPWIPLY
jgi:hypothetical protein